MKKVFFILGSLNVGVSRCVAGHWSRVMTTPMRRFDEALLGASTTDEWENIPKELRLAGVEWITHTFCHADSVICAESSLFSTLPFWSQCFAEAGFTDRTAVICFHDPFLEYRALRNQTCRGVLFRRCRTYDAYLARYAIRAHRVLGGMQTERISLILYADWSVDAERELMRVEKVCKLSVLPDEFERAISCQFQTFIEDIHLRKQAYLEETKNVIWTLSHIASEMQFDSNWKSVVERCRDNMNYLASFREVASRPEPKEGVEFLKLADVMADFNYFRRITK